MSDTPNADGLAAGPTDAAEAAAAGDATTKAPVRLMRKDAILTRKDRKYKDVPVPEWGEAGEPAPIVRIQSLSGKELEEFQAGIVEQGSDGTAKTKIKGLRAKFAVRVIVDDDGRKIFDDSDVGALSEKSSAALQRIWDEGTELSRMGQNKIEDTAKN